MQHELDFERNFVRQLQHLSPSRSPFAAVMDWFRFMQKSTQLAFALCLLVASAGAWFTMRFFTLTESLNTLGAERSQLEQKEKALQEQLADEQQRSRDLAENLDKAKLPVISYVLSPGGVRSAGDVPKLILPSSPVQLELRLDLEGVKQSERYDAVLYDERNVIVMRWEAVRSMRRANGLQVSLSLQSRLLEARRYRIELDGKNEFVFSFAVGGRWE